LIITGTIYDIFENLGGYLILTQSTGTKNAFNPLFYSNRGKGKRKKNEKRELNSTSNAL
jgi:hypothetical protein